MNSMKPRLAVDIGGTFTDIAIEQHGRILTAKTLTTPDAPVDGVITGIAHALDGTELSPGDFGTIIHGTTLATNALIERRGAKVAVITTEGFRDILEIGYERRYDQYDLYLEKQDMIVPRDLVFTVRERIDASGDVLAPLDAASVDAAVARAIRAGAECIAVCLLHSYKNAAHECIVRAVIERLAPEMPVSLSSEVSPEIREFDRLCTTVCNAYIKPLMAGYLAEFERAVSAGGFDCPIFVITSGGGMTTLDTARAYPIRLVESGPSGGAVLAARIARQVAAPNVLSFDMGGTTAKVCLIENGTPQTTRTFEIGRAERFLKGSGIPVRIPVVDMIEIGAGGGSIASVDALGRLRVGPRSASSDPGPACYGRGGAEPTVTDADVVIGYIDPDGFAEGRVSIDPELSEAAIGRAISEPLGTAVITGADGIGRMVDEAMANAARMHAAERGKTLADCTMVAFGGNGPLHATRVAEKIGVRRIIVPRDPSVGSAVGFLFAPVSFELVRSHPVRLSAFDHSAVDQLLSDMEMQSRRIVMAGAGGAPLSTSRTAFMRYVGQGHEIEVEVPSGQLDQAKVVELTHQFETAYTSQFGRTVPEMEIEVINWAVVVRTTPPPPGEIGEGSDERQPLPSSTRTLRIGDQGAPIDAGVFERSRLTRGDRIDGPALIVEPQTTTFVSSAFSARIDLAGNIVMSRVAQTQPFAVQAQARTEIELQVMWDRLLAIVEEQAQALMHAAFSPIVRECGDISAGIFDTEGRMLAQAVTGTPGHINTMAMSVSKMLQHIPLDQMAPGDVYTTNDPWIGAGHLNDLLMVAPIFHQGRPVALSSCTSHVYDLGGSGMGPDGKDVHDEGLYLPPVKLVDRGQINQMLVDIFKANSRSPIANEGDMYALIACCDTADRRLCEMLREFSIDGVEALGAHIFARSHEATVAALSQIPSGDYDCEMMLDGYDTPIKLKARMTVTGSEIVTDFTGSAGQVARGINVPINYSAAYGVFATRCLVAPDIPNNAGSLAPFRFTAPEDCIAAAKPPAAVASRHSIGHMIADLCLGCLAQAMPERVPAEGSTCLWDLPIRNDALAGMSGSATPFAAEFSHSGGTGARPMADGLSATAYPSGVWGTQVEIAESTCPVRYRRRDLIQDSGGVGRHRGGLGQLIELESSEGAPILFFGTVERTKFAARGRAGGGDGRLGKMTLRSGPSFVSKGEQTIPAGDVLSFETPGGAGYGDPLEREPAAVARDVRLGLVSENSARQDYGVVLGPDGVVDDESTSACRSELRKKRTEA